MAAEDGHDDAAARRLPTAQIRKRHGWTLLWLVPVFAAGVVGWLAYREFGHTGYQIRIRFEDASGVEPGKSLVQFRGVEVGRVQSLVLSDDRRHTVVSAALAHDYEDLAREGTLFWIVRPRLTGAQLKGLSTVASQNYISLQLGTGKGRPRQFDGAEMPPVTEQTAQAQPGLTIHLRAPERWGLERGSTVQYRGADAGWVLSYEVARDGSAVTFDAFIKERFAPFVQSGSEFYRDSGIDLSAGLFKGVELQVGDLQSLFAGGVAFATPPGDGDRVVEGTTFEIHEKAEDEWKQWTSEIAGTTVPEAED